MGYRSEVALTIKKEDESRLLLAIKNYDQRVFNSDSGCETASKVLGFAQRVEMDNAQYVSYYWSCIKWYETFKSINFFYRELDRLEIQYDFLRVGEESSDIEERGTLYSGICYPHTQIAFAY